MKILIAIGPLIITLSSCNSQSYNADKTKKKQVNMNVKNQVTNWLNRINQSEKVNRNIVAYNFGLFETEEGYTIYLIGSEEFDENDDNWAANVDFEPKEKYLNLIPSEIKGKDWEEVLNISIQTLTEYIQSDSYKMSIFQDAEAITTGFDDGDLTRIK